MFKNKILRNPVFLSTLVALLLAAALAAVFMLWLTQMDRLYLWAGLGVIAVLYIVFQITLWLKKRSNSKAQKLETEEEALSMVIAPLLSKAGKKPIYLLLGNKGAGKAQFLTNSNAIKPMDKSRTAKNDFFEWYESDSAVYIKPDQRLVYQEVSSADAALWLRLVKDIIRHRPRKPFAGCLFFIDFEFLIVNENDQIEYTLNALLDRLETIGQETSAALPIYLVMSKLDKLEGFKEYVQFSTLKTSLEFLSIPLKEAKGAVTDYYLDSYQNLVKVMESNALDSSANTTSIDEKQAILAFPKQFELCKSEIGSLIERISSVNHGQYLFDMREVFFCSSIQGGRKYNLLAKTCSNYFNLPIIASEHTHLSETPFFTRFLVDSQILPEADFAGENKAYLKKLQRKSRITIGLGIAFVASSAYFFFNTLESNISVINTLMGVNSVANEQTDSQSFDAELQAASKSVESAYEGWLSGSTALDKEVASLKISRLNDSTKIAYKALSDQLTNKLIPLIEKGYRLELAKNQRNLSRALPLLKGYLMLKEPQKRDAPFLRKQTALVLQDLSSDQATVAKVNKYFDAYLRDSHDSVAIDMDIVRATRRALLAHSNVDLVYARLIQQADDIDLGSLDIERFVGFDFYNIFDDQIDHSRLQVSKVYTATGFSTFYRPRVDLMSEQVISDNWVLGLSNNVIPTPAEQEAFKQKVRKKYTDDYISYWRNALSELKVKKYETVGDITNAIDLISGPSSPMTTVLKEVFNNTHFTRDDTKQAVLAKTDDKLTDALEKVVDSAEQVVQPDYVLMQRVEKAFHNLNQLQVSETTTSSTPWEETVTALSQVRNYMKDIADSPDPQMTALAVARQRISSTEADPLIRLKQIADRSPEPVRSWLLDVVNQSWSVIIKESSRGIQTQWYSQVYSKFKELGLGKYPFDLKAEKEISLEDFELLFASGGILDNFIKENFAPFYDTNLWQPKRLDGETMELSQQALVQLRNYNVIRDVLINKGTNKMYIPFSAEVMDMDSSAMRANIQIADGSFNYFHGPSRVQELQWPPKDGNYKISLTIQDVTDEGTQHVLNKNGQWALYRLFGDSTLTNTHDGSFTSDISISGRSLRLRITPHSPTNPFTLDELYNFTLPEQIEQ
ncbi:type VI secretion system protein ImpL [Vibrio xiamenensis]|uniref:Type VI secretion system protein ImpL n=1 Tax=Vibrio xiamenensis TaxID=861298 RepID=A0A1G8DT37_9VIBR|nr:type VI secretion system membrane subunit TssM [Vibrio xiamenensis]SDH60853.1 type VI secretion system protein ImpL [Vibrio xiamenensis]